MVCCAFDVPTSCFYDYLARRRTINRERMQQRSELRRLFKERRSSAGSRALMSMMRELGYQIGRFKVRKLMKEAGLASKQPGAHRYKVAQSERPDIPNLLACEYDVQQPNQVWCGDITYVWAGGRWHYLAAVLDLHTRRVVGWAMSDKPDAELAIKALEMAYQQRGCPSGVLFHSDQGCQYGSRAFRQRVWRYRMTQSMSRRGNCWDNAPMERLFRSLKSEWLTAMGYMSLRAAKRDISYYLMDNYNWRRPHHHNDYRQQKPRIGLTKFDHYNRTISHPYTHLKNRLSNIDSNYVDRVHVVLPQVERCQPKYETDSAGWGRPSHHYRYTL